jgi:putative tryptophan/tyrosine transport system substrate-binding protein
MTEHTRRREFITLLGGAAVAWPLAVRAQQGGGMRRVAIVMAYPPSDAVMQSRVQALQQELQRLGWTKGVNILFDERWTTDNMELVRANVANVVDLNPDVIVSTGGRVNPLFMQLTRSTPIVIPGFGDPVAQGWVESLARPGGNITGFTFFEYSVLGKMLGTLKQIAPGMSRVAIVYNPDNAASAQGLRLTEGFARSLAIEPMLAPIRGLADFDRMLESVAQQSNGGVFSFPDLTVTQLRVQIAALAAKHRVPAIYSDRTIVTSGGLVSYDADRLDIFRRAASYIDRILRGEKPGDLPIQQPTKYQLTINLKTAKAMGLDIPATVLALADEVIE